MSDSIELFAGDPTRFIKDRRIWENWDKPGVAQTIESIWNIDPSDIEKKHRTKLAYMVCDYITPTSKVLEVGCGTGLVYEALVEGKIVQNKNYRGIDISDSMLEIAKSKYPNGSFSKGDIYAIMRRDADVDAVLCFETLVHLLEIDVPISELIRVAKNVVLFTVWISSVRSFGIQKINNSEFIYQFFLKENIENAISKSTGVGKVECRYMHPVPLAAGSASADLACWLYAVYKENHEYKKNKM